MTSGAETAGIRGIGREMPGEPSDERVLDQGDVGSIAGDGPDQGRDRHDADTGSFGRGQSPVCLVGIHVAVGMSDEDHLVPERQLRPIRADVGVDGV